MSASVFHQISLLTILGISVPVVMEDLKTKRIPNTWILAGIAVGTILLLAALAAGVIDAAHLVRILGNTLISFFLGFFIWKAGLWPPGDAKLFIVFSFLMPLHYYSLTYLPYFPAFVLLVNTLFVYLVFLVIRSLARMTDLLVRSQESRRRSMRVWNIYVRRKMLRLRKATKYRYFKFRYVSKMIPRLAVLGAAGVLIVRGVIAWRIFLVYALFFVVLKAVTDVAMNLLYKRRVPVAQIHRGMHLAPETAMMIAKDPDLASAVEALRPEGLSAKEAGRLVAVLPQRGVRSVFVRDTISFSPWIVAGACLTMLLKGSAVQIIQQFDYYKFILFP